MTAPLIVQGRAETREDRQPIVIMLHDFSFRPRRPSCWRASPASTAEACAERMATQTENAGPERQGRRRERR